MQDVTDAEIDRDRVPGRADAERIDMAIGEAVHHVGRRQHHEANVLVGIDPACRHPEPELVIVGRERERHAEGQRLRSALAALCHDAGKRQRGGHGIDGIALDLTQDCGM